MSSDRETTRAVRSWLEEGVTALPDRVLDVVLDQLPATPQRRPWWPWQRFTTPRSFAPLATAAALVLVLVIGYNVVPGSGPTPTPSPPQSPSPSEALFETPMPVTPGRQSLEGYPVGISFTVPSGWSWCSEGQHEQGVCGDASSPQVGFLIVANVVADPCGDALLDPPPGPTVDDLVAAISGLSGFTTTTPTEITIDGFAGKELTVTAPTSPRAECPNLGTWATRDRTNRVDEGEANLVRVVDVDGTRVVLTGAYAPSAEAADARIAEIKEVMNSVTFTP